MINALINYQARSLDYAKKLVADLTPAQWCAQPKTDTGLVKNHAAWIIGHLVWVADKATMGRCLAQPGTIDEAWNPLFGGKSEPSADTSLYPDKAALMGLYEDAVNRIAAYLKTCDASLLHRATPDEAFRKRFPTIGFALMHVMVGHEMLHLGQLSAWRRALGLGTV
ncbi:MAG: DinB family protein [Phycisphaeraceae bacterium]